MSTGQMAAPCSWKDNCRSGIALVIHHRLHGYIYLRTQWIKNGR